MRDADKSGAYLLLYKNQNQNQTLNSSFWGSKKVGQSHRPVVYSFVCVCYVVVVCLSQEWNGMKWESF